MTLDEHTQPDAASNDAPATSPQADGQASARGLPESDQPTVTMSSPFADAGDDADTEMARPAGAASAPPTITQPTATVDPVSQQSRDAETHAGSETYDVADAAAPRDHTTPPARAAAAGPPLPPTEMAFAAPPVTAPPPPYETAAAPPPYQTAAAPPPYRAAPAPPPGVPPTGQPPYGAVPTAPPTPPNYPSWTPVPGMQPPPKRGRTGLIVALVAAGIIIVVGAATAVILTVSNSDKSAIADTAGTQTAPISTQNTVTVTKTAPGGSGSSSGTSKRGSPGKSTRKAAPSPVPTASSLAERTTVSRVAIKGLIRRHFQNIVDGNYVSAYSDLTGAATTATEASWISTIREDRLYSFSVAVSPQLTSATTGVATIIQFRTQADASGCKNWSGSWSVARIGGRWRISKSNLRQSPTFCGE
ncbi:MAG TPA: hypothetical protein VFY45_18205 [Baekduia sp.]|nr:hypothetical protein [Baekduia sp.]